MVENNAHRGGSQTALWESLYSGDLEDYQSPDADLIEMIATLSPGNALDVGCGAGGLCIELDRMGWSATGVDITANAITSAQLIAEKHGSKATFEIADATTWQPNERYNLVCSNFGLPPQPEKRMMVYDMISRAVVSGGVVLIKVGDHSGDQWPLPPQLAGYRSLNAEELKSGFGDFEVLIEKFVDMPAHSHHGHAQTNKVRKSLIFMARKSLQ